MNWYDQDRNRYDARQNQADPQGDSDYGREGNRSANQYGSQDDSSQDRSGSRGQQGYGQQGSTPYGAQGAYEANRQEGNRGYGQG